MGAVLQKMMGGEVVPEIDIQFEGVEVPQQLSHVKEVVNSFGEVVEMIEKYQNCSDLCRKAMNKETPTAEDEAWDAVIARVGDMRKFYEVSNRVGEVVKELIGVLTHPNAQQALTDNPAACHLFAEIIDCALRFDEQKMMNPHLLNDFTYFKRNLNKRSLGDDTLREDANRIALFLANASPMMQTLITTASSEEKGNSNVTSMLSALANLTLSLVVYNKTNSDRERMLCLRTMTGSIVLFDHVDPLGVFRKGSPVAIKKAITTLKTQKPTPDILLNAIRFSTVHYKDATTPASLKALLE
eukprot:Rmarinus@m.16999